jgi:hypothetical protein
MMVLRWIPTIIWWLIWANLQISTSWKTFGSILVSGDNKNENDSSIHANGFVNKSYVVNSGEFFVISIWFSEDQS